MCLYTRDQRIIYLLHLFHKCISLVKKLNSRVFSTFFKKFLYYFSKHYNQYVSHRYTVTTKLCNGYFHLSFFSGLPIEWYENDFDQTHDSLKKLCEIKVSLTQTNVRATRVA